MQFNMQTVLLETMGYQVTSKIGTDLYKRYATIKPKKILMLEGCDEQLYEVVIKDLCDAACINTVMSMCQCVGKCL